MITPLMHTPVLALLTSLAASFITVVIGLFVGRRATEAFSTIIGALLFMLTFLTFVNVFFVDGSYAYYLGGWPPPVGIPYVIDHYSASLGLVVSLVFFLVILYSLKYIEEDRDVKWYYSLLLLMQGGMLGVIFAGDVFLSLIHI